MLKFHNFLPTSEVWNVIPLDYIMKGRILGINGGFYGCDRVACVCCGWMGVQQRVDLPLGIAVDTGAYEVV